MTSLTIGWGLHGAEPGGFPDEREGEARWNLEKHGVTNSLLLKMAIYSGFTH